MSEAARSRDRRYVKRHSAVVRVTHWVNAFCVLVLLMSGLQIFNAHPALYWGNISNFDDPFLAMRAERRPDGPPVGVTILGDYRFETTGLFGLSEVGEGRLAARG